MSGIVEFLEARIAEDEAQANAVDLLSSEMETISTHYLPEFADYMLRWQPKAVRAECAAKRGILDDYTGSPAMFQILMHMAAVYADHPDYKPDWA